MELSVEEIKTGDYVQVQAEGVETWIPCQVREKTDQGASFFLLLEDRGYELRTMVVGGQLTSVAPDWASTPGKRIRVKPISLTIEQVNKMKVARNEHESNR